MSDASNGGASNLRNIGLVVPPTLHERLRGAAAATGKPLSVIATEALCRAVTELEAATNGGEPFPAVTGRLPVRREYRRVPANGWTEAINQGPGASSPVK